MREAASKRAEMEAEVGELRQQLEEAAAEPGGSRVKRVHRQVIHRMNAINRMVSESTRALQDIDSCNPIEGENEDDDNDHVSYVARSISSKQTAKLQDEMAAMETVNPDGDGESSNLVVLADAPVFRSVLVPRRAREEVEIRLTGFQAARAEGNEKAINWAKRAFLRALMRSLVSDEEFSITNYSGRKSAKRVNNISTPANAAKVRLVRSYAEMFGGITPSLPELQRAYSRCRETASARNERRREKASPAPAADEH